MNLSRLEQETIITFNEAESFAEVFTHNGRLKRRLAELLENRPEDVEDRGEDYGSQRYRVPKKWIRIQAPNRIKNLTEEERDAVKKRLEKGREQKRE